MIDTDQLKALQERVKAATGYDPQLNYDIAQVLEPHQLIMSDTRCAYTGSVDITLALIARVLPEANCHGYDYSPNIKYEAYVSHNVCDSHRWASIGEHQYSISCAFLLALFHALMSDKLAEHRRFLQESNNEQAT